MTSLMHLELSIDVDVDGSHILELASTQPCPALRERLSAAFVRALSVRDVTGLALTDMLALALSLCAYCDRSCADLKTRISALLIDLNQAQHKYALAQQPVWKEFSLSLGRALNRMDNRHGAANAVIQLFGLTFVNRARHSAKSSPDSSMPAMSAQQQRAWHDLVTRWHCVTEQKTASRDGLTKNTDPAMALQLA